MEVAPKRTSLTPVVGCSQIVTRTRLHGSHPGPGCRVGPRMEVARKMTSSTPAPELHLLFLPLSSLPFPLHTTHPRTCKGAGDAPGPDGCMIPKRSTCHVSSACHVRKHDHATPHNNNTRLDSTRFTRLTNHLSSLFSYLLFSSPLLLSRHVSRTRSRSTPRSRTARIPALTVTPEMLRV